MIEVQRDARGKFLRAEYVTDEDLEYVPMLTEDAVYYARRTGTREVAQRKCVCRFCGQDINKGDKRLTFEFYDRMIGRGHWIPGYLHVEECKRDEKN